MKLFLVEQRGWGFEVAVVRAEDEQAAIDLAKIYGNNTEVTELATDGEPSVLWQYENCPDSPRGE